MRGRIRTIKPELLSDEELWDLGQEYPDLHILQSFEGLWMYADREGRFEWRPRALGAHILPYWQGDFSRVLDALATRGFVVRYEVDSREYGLVRTFRKHQVINNREADSELPAPPKESAAKTMPCATREPRVNHASSTREGPAPVEGNGKGREPTRARACEGPVESPPGGLTTAQSETSSGHQQEVLDAFREAYDSGTMPRLYGQRLLAAVEHCRAVANDHHVPLRDAAKAICKAAVPGAKDWDFRLAKVDPYTPQRSPPHAANGYAADDDDRYPSFPISQQTSWK